MRWWILFVLFVARMAMAFQFASVGATGPLYEQAFGLSAARLGFLIGLYFLPGVVVALPGGGLGARFGDKRVLLAGLLLMTLGGGAAAVFDVWSVQVAARVVAGVGAVLLNVVMTKMVADWFAGREIGTAMAVFVNSYPAGIAVALFGLPVIATFAGLQAATMAVAVFALAGLALVALFYGDPPGAPAAASRPARPMPRGLALAAVIAAGLGWGIFNGAFSMFFNFGPANLVERGHDLVSAGTLTSAMIWLVMAAGILGGILNDLTGRPLTIYVSASLLSIGGLVAFPVADNLPLVIAVLGVGFGLPTSIYMVVGTRGLAGSERALGMGVFYTTYFLVFMVIPYIAGAMIDASGTTASAFRLAAGLMVLAMASVGVALRLQRLRTRRTSA